MLKRSIIGAAAGLAIAASLAPTASAQALDLRWEALSSDERAIIDRLAADFYEHELRYAQSSTIEQHTSELYAQATPTDRAAFRADRRAAWLGMEDAERDGLRGAKRPAFDNLAEAQKSPFRQYALDQLGAAGAIDYDALAAALRNDV